MNKDVADPAGQRTTLWLSTIVFAVCFAVWTIFSIIGVQIKQNLGLNATEFGLVIGTPIVAGSIICLNLGIWTDRYGGRIVYVAVMLCAAVATWLLTFAYDYTTLLIAALGVGVASGSFADGLGLFWLYASQKFASDRPAADRAYRPSRSTSIVPCWSGRSELQQGI